MIEHSVRGHSVVDSDTVPPYPERSVAVYGAGQISYSYQGHRSHSHSGGYPGFRSHIVRYIDQKLGIAVLTNDNNFGNHLASMISFFVAEEILGLVHVDWQARSYLFCNA